MGILFIFELLIVTIIPFLSLYQLDTTGRMCYIANLSRLRFKTENTSLSEILISLHFVNLLSASGAND